MKYIEVIFIGLVLVFVLFTGCGGSDSAAQAVEDNYQMIDIRSSKIVPEDKAYIYQAGESVSAVASRLSEVQQPEKMTEANDERMLMVYPEGLIDIRQDPQNAGGSILELMSMEYAANNYERNYFVGNNFLTGYIAAEILDEVFDTMKYKYKYDSKTSSGWRSVRSGGWFRGGGPGVGK